MSPSRMGFSSNDESFEEAKSLELVRGYLLAIMFLLQD